MEPNTDEHTAYRNAGPDRRPVLRLCAAVRPGQRTRATRLARAIQLHGVVTDGDGKPVPDALLEIWQADADGVIPKTTGSFRRDGWTFTGWGRAGTDDEGRYSFSTVLPGATQPDSAPFILVTVFARGLLNRLFTRAYLPGEQLASDPAAELAARRTPSHPGGGP
jgi:protocatechuate 3,4-dioxygenase beta subunit